MREGYSFRAGVVNRSALVDSREVKQRFGCNIDISSIQQQKWTVVLESGLLFASLFKVYKYWTCDFSKLHQSLPMTFSSTQQHTRQLWSRLDEWFSKYVKDYHPSSECFIVRWTFSVQAEWPPWNYLIQLKWAAKLTHEKLHCLHEASFAVRQRI